MSGRHPLGAAIVLIMLPCVPAGALTPGASVQALSSETVAARIDAALATGELDVAANLIERNLSDMPKGRLLLARADYALAAGEIDSALAGFNGLVDDPSVSARAQLGIGLVQLRQGRDVLAITALDGALKNDPLLIKAWIARGVAADRQRDWDRADISYARALVIDPRSAAALANRGYSKLLRGRFVEAASDSALALTIDAKLVTAAKNLRLARAMLGDYKSAFTGSTKITLADDLNTVGFAAMSRGDYGTAETFFTRAMRMSPQFDRTAWDNLVYLKQLAHKQTDNGTTER